MIKSYSNILQSLTKLQKQAPELAIKACKPHRNLIEDLNTDEQMQAQGQRADGQPIRPAYTAFTKAIKQQKGQPTNRVTLRDTGDFHRSVFVTFRKTEFELQASDVKTPSLTRKYGREVLGLTQDSIDKVAASAKQDMQRLARKRVVG